ncbi:SGNH/GDSL hydrolase family protein [Paenibacillus puerhi]|uniref:SGNH/GDSL hydrolase family protein n=1 Tax=Paenibacillus puerhi TaxID=2692622 RepID=UPI00135CD0B8|nr:SGNH/GDSL hydrolase family protein [Paenibacillus puerhi]
MLFAKHDKLVMIGDSITDCGRKRPYGEGRNDAYGSGYVSAVNALLQSTYPELMVRIVNMGISGNTVRDLQARWDTDVLDLKPDWVSIMIGINDVWRQFDQPQITESHVYMEEYRETLDALVAVTKPQVKGIILLTPFYIEPNPEDAMRGKMDEYGQVVKETAARHDAVLVDVQAALAPLLAHRYPASLAWDRVHPDLTGHMAIARAFLDGVGFAWSGSSR